MISTIIAILGSGGGSGTATPQEPEVPVNALYIDTEPLMIDSDYLTTD